MQSAQLPDGLQLPELAGTQVVAFVLVLARVGPLFLLAPVLSSGMLAARAKFLAAAAFAVALTPIAVHGVTVPEDPVGLAQALAEEAGVGVAFALSLGVLTAAVQAGASLLDTLVGFSFGSIVDPLTGVQAAVLGQTYSMFALMIFVLTGGIRLMVMGLARSYELVPLGSFPSAGALGRLALAALSQVPVIALELVGPVLLAVVLADGAFGLIARAVPQMNVFVIGLPVKVIVAFAVVGASLPFVGTHLEGDLQHQLARALQGLAGG
jgi:flagellar biosynthetic protein FliR